MPEGIAAVQAMPVLLPPHRQRRDRRIRRRSASRAESRCQLHELIDSAHWRNNIIPLKDEPRDRMEEVASRRSSGAPRRMSVGRIQRCAVVRQRMLIDYAGWRFIYPAYSITHQLIGVCCRVDHEDAFED